MDPIDYSAGFANVPSPIQSFTQGLQTGAGVQQIQLQQQQQQQALAQQQMQGQVIHSLVSNPNAGAAEYSKAMTMLPGIADKLKAAWDTKNAAAQQQELSDLTQWSSAIQSGNPKLASDGMRARADAVENAAGQPTQQSKLMRAQADSLDAHPEFGNFMINMKLMAHPDGPRVINAIAARNSDQRAQDLHPAAVDTAVAGADKAVADASKAQSDATVAAATIPAQIQRPTEENLTAENQRKVADFNAQISAANSETDRGRLVFERDKFIAENKLKGNAIAEGAQSQLNAYDQSIATVNQIMNHSLLKSDWGVGTTFGKIAGTVPGTQNHDFRALVDTLKSQQFMNQIKELKDESKTGGSGMGALSDAEGARIERAVSSLDTDQSQPAFKNAVGVIQATLNKARARVIGSGKLSTSAAPGAAGGFVANVPGIGTVNEGDINRLLAQNPGSTREQAIAYLNSIGKK